MSTCLLIRPSFHVKGLKKLKDALNHHPMFDGRRLHLLAYLHLLRGKREKCKAQLRKCCSKSKDMGLWLEVEWAKKHMNVWFSDDKESDNVYEGKSMFTLPKPRAVQLKGK